MVSCIDCARKAARLASAYRAESGSESAPTCNLLPATPVVAILMLAAIMSFQWYTVEPANV